MPKTMLLGLVDLENTGSGLAMADAVMWEVCVRWKLKFENAIISCTDSTNSMSGTGKVGGCIEQLRRSMPAQPRMPRLPCTLHAWHLGIQNSLAELLFGALPARLDRSHVHLWNFLWDIYLLFGKPNTWFYFMSEIALRFGFVLTVSQKPVGTRWEFLPIAAWWVLANLEELILLHEAVHFIFFLSLSHNYTNYITTLQLAKELGGESKLGAVWKRVWGYLNNSTILAQLHAFAAFCLHILTPIHCKLIAAPPMPLLFVSADAEGQRLPAGFAHTHAHKHIHIHTQHSHTHTQVQRCDDRRSLSRGSRAPEKGT
jgi:hypothetical protein